MFRIFYLVVSLVFWVMSSAQGVRYDKRDRTFFRQMLCAHKQEHILSDFDYLMHKNFLHRKKKVSLQTYPEDSTFIQTQRNRAFDLWMSKFHKAAPAQDLVKKIHFIWRDNPLPDFFYIGFLNVCSLALHKGWTVCLWTNRPKDLLNTWKEVRTNGFERALPAPLTIESTIAEEAEADIGEERRFAKYIAQKCCDPQKKGKCFEQLKAYLKEDSSKSLSFLDPIKETLWPGNQLSDFRDLFRVFSKEKELITSIIGSESPEDLLQIQFAPFFMKQWTLHESLKDPHPLTKSAIDAIFSLEIDINSHKITRVPESIKDHLERLQRYGVLQIRHTAHIYSESEKVLDHSLYPYIRSIQVFEGTGIKNYGSITDIERKLVLMLEGGVYSDFDGIQLNLPRSISQVPHTFKVPFHNNDPYFSHNSKELWSAVLWEIVARYEKCIDQSLLQSKKVEVNDQRYTCFLTGPGLMCEYSDSGPIIDSVIENQGWFVRIKKDKGLAYNDYLQNFVLKSRAYKKDGTFTKSDFLRFPKSHFVKILKDNPLGKYGAMYIIDSDDFVRAVFYGQTWVGKKGQKRKGFVAPDTLDFL